MQIDGSEHAWFEDREPSCTMLAFVDDATSRLMQLRFVASESAFDYFRSTRSYLEEHSKPLTDYIAAHALGMTIGPNTLILPPLNRGSRDLRPVDGLGHRQPEFQAFGISLSERAPRFSESIALMCRLWTEERVNHKGRF